MRNDKRQESLEKIKNDPDTTVILISFKAGSTGESLMPSYGRILIGRFESDLLQQRCPDGPMVESSVRPPTTAIISELINQARRSSVRSCSSASLTLASPDKLTFRLGQKLDVNIYKLTVSNTVEDRTSSAFSRTCS